MRTAAASEFTREEIGWIREADGVRWGELQQGFVGLLGLHWVGLCHGRYWLAVLAGSKTDGHPWKTIL